MMNIIEQKNKEPYYISQLIGICLKHYRKEKNLSGHALAQKLNISQQQLSRYERGVNAITVGTLFKILVTLNIRFDVFYIKLINMLFKHSEFSLYFSYLEATGWQLDNIKNVYFASTIS